MESSRSLVTGLPDGATKTDLTIYFQSTRDSGDGDVKDIQIDGNQAPSKMWKIRSSEREGKNLLKQYLRLLFVEIQFLIQYSYRKNPSRELQTP